MLEQRDIELLFRQNYNEMTHLARVLLGNDEEAEDVVQDIYLAQCLEHIRKHFNIH